jgi:hypothetical protein
MDAAGGAESLVTAQHCGSGQSCGMGAVDDLRVERAMAELVILAEEYGQSQAFPEGVILRCPRPWSESRHGARPLSPVNGWLLLSCVAVIQARAVTSASRATSAISM